MDDMPIFHLAHYYIYHLSSLINDHNTQEEFGFADFLHIQRRDEDTQLMNFPS